MKGTPRATRPAVVARGRRLPPAYLQTLQRVNRRPARNVLWVRVKSQRMLHFLRSGPVAEPHYTCVHSPYVISTSRFGIGQRENSNRTPLGLHRIARKIGRGQPAGTVFKGRKPVGHTWDGMRDAKITDRILWLEGLEPGLNRGGNVDSFRRYIYIHGTGDQSSLGQPASCGCVHVGTNDLLPLFAVLPVGTHVWISER